MTDSSAKSACHSGATHSTKASFSSRSSFDLIEFT